MSPVLLLLLQLGPAPAEPDDPALPAGLRVLYEQPMQSFSFRRELFEELWLQWPEADRDRAAAADPDTRYRMLLDHYGLHLDPRRGNDIPAAFSGVPGSEWTLNCLACHGGSVDGSFLPGLPNNTLMLEDLVTDVAMAKGAERTLLEDGMLLANMGHTIGATEATLFGELLLALREPDLELKSVAGVTAAGVANAARMAALPDGLLPLDAPAWWQLRDKTHMYLDGSVERNHRTVMQFALGINDLAFEDDVRAVLLEGDREALAELFDDARADRILALREAAPNDESFERDVVRSFRDAGLLERAALLRHVRTNGITGEEVRSWDDEFEAIFGYILDLPAPPYPHPIDRDLAEAGRDLFNQSCAECHGRDGGEGPRYRPKRVSLARVGTDPLYPTALDQRFRDRLEGFLTFDGEVEVVDDAEADRGYVAPPLRGVWATAPYLHNGSVPTLEDLLDHDGRAARVEARGHLWTFEPGAYDHERLGLAATFLAPEERSDDPRVHDSERRGMSALGHDFGRSLDAEERRAVLEYLKTL